MNQKNVILVLNAQDIIRKIKNKYGENPIISEIGKQKKALYDAKKSI